MVKIRYIATGILILTGCLYFAVSLLEGDTTRIRNQVETLSRLASKKGGESELAAGIASRRIGRLFATPCRMDLSLYDIHRNFEPRDMAAHTMALRGRYRKITLDIYDLNFVEINESHAIINFTAVLDAQPNGGGNYSDIHEISCRMEKMDGEWYFREIKTIAVLER